MLTSTEIHSREPITIILTAEDLVKLFPQIPIPTVTALDHFAEVVFATAAVSEAVFSEDKSTEPLSNFKSKHIACLVFFLFETMKSTYCFTRYAVTPSPSPQAAPAPRQPQKVRRQSTDLSLFLIVFESKTP